MQRIPRLALTILIFLITQTFQKCLEYQNKGQGEIVARKLAANSSLLILDHFLIFRILSLQTKNIVYEIDLKPYLHATGNKDSYAKSGYFHTDSILYIMTQTKYFKINFETITTTLIDYHTYGSNSKISPMFNLPAGEQSYTGFLNSDKIQMAGITHKIIHFMEWKASDFGTKFTGVTAIPTPSLSPEVRIYATIDSKKISYTWFSINAGAGIITPIVESSTSITSNIAIKDSENLIAYGISQKTILTGKELVEGGIRFRKMNLANRFKVSLKYIFTKCQFHPSTKKIILTDVQGYLCIYGYDLVAETAVMESCHAVAALEFDIEFMGNSMVLFRESMIAVYDFDSVLLKFAYSPQPGFRDERGQKQIHVFPGVKIRVFDTNLLAYDEGNLLEGNVYKAKFNPNNSTEMEVFAIVDLKLIKRIRVSDSTIVQEFDPIGASASGSNFKECVLFDLDLYASKSSFVAFYRCLKVSDDIKTRVVIIHDLDTPANNIEISTDVYYDYPTQAMLKGENDDMIYSGFEEIDYWKSSTETTTSRLNFKSDFSSTNPYPDYNLPSLNLEKVEGYTINFNQFGALVHNTNNDGKFFVEGSFDLRISSCLSQTIPEDLITIPNKPNMLQCGGSGFLQASSVLDSPYNYKLILRNSVSGVIFKGVDGEVYLQQNEDSRVKYTGKTESCFSGDIKSEYFISKLKCLDPNCFSCDIETGKICKKCQNDMVAKSGNCVSDCDPGTYRFDGYCVQHCPLHYYKQGGSTPRCVLECEFPTLFKLGDFCSSCSGGDFVKDGPDCKCVTGKILTEEGNCVLGTECPSGYFWPQYNMCLSIVRNSSEYLIYNNGKNVYCDKDYFLDYNGGMKCIEKCMPPGVVFEHSNYGKMCINKDNCKNEFESFYDPGFYRCVQTCQAPSNLLVSLTSECHAICPEDSVLETFYLESNSSCVSEAQCQILKTPSHHFSVPSLKKCVVGSCPEGFYTIFESFLCVTVTGCQSQGRYTMNDSLTCLSLEGCLKEKRTVNKIINDCSVGCVLGEVWSEGLAKCITEEKEEEEDNDVVDSVVDKDDDQKEKTSFLFSWFIYIEHTLMLLYFLIGPLFIKSSSTTNFFAYIFHDLQKISLFKYYNFHIEGNVRDFYLRSFTSLENSLSGVLYSLIKEDLKKEDENNLCSKNSSNLCRLQTRSSFLINQIIPIFYLMIITLIFAVLKLLSKCSKKLKKLSDRIQFRSFSNFWMANQPSIIFSLVLNLSTPIFSNWFFIASFCLSVILAILIFGFFISIIDDHKARKNSYVKLVWFESLRPLFSYYGEGFLFAKLHFYFDTLMALSLGLAYSVPIIQCLVGLFFQIVFAYFMFKKIHFKRKNLNYRTMITEGVFVLMNCMFFVSSIYKQPKDYVSWIIFLSGFFVYIINSIYFLSMVFEIIKGGLNKEKIEKDGKKKNGENIDTARNLKTEGTREGRNKKNKVKAENERKIKRRDLDDEEDKAKGKPKRRRNRKRRENHFARRIRRNRRERKKVYTNRWKQKEEEMEEEKIKEDKMKREEIKEEDEIKEKKDEFKKKRFSKKRFTRFKENKDKWKGLEEDLNKNDDDDKKKDRNKKNADEWEGISTDKDSKKRVERKQNADEWEGLDDQEIEKFEKRKKRRRKTKRKRKSKYHREKELGSSDEE